MPKNSDVVVVVNQEGEIQQNKEIGYRETTLMTGQARKISEALSGNIPVHAIREREGRAGKVFKYVEHGYVTDKLNEVFGPFWDWELIPVSNGKLYDIITYQEIGNNGIMKDIQEVIVIGRLTVRIYSEQGILIETIIRTGEDGKIREKNIPFADVIQSASSGAFKRGAFRFGKVFGLGLYYDDELRKEEYEENVRASLPKEPETIAQLVVRMRTEGIKESEFFSVTGYNIGDTGDNGLPRPYRTEIPEIWNKLIKNKGNK